MFYFPNYNSSKQISDFRNAQRTGCWFHELWSFMLKRRNDYGEVAWEGVTVVEDDQIMNVNNYD